MKDNASVIGVHNLRSRSMGGLGYLDAHIEVDSDLTVSEAHYIAHHIEHQVKKRFPKIIDVQIHIDPLDDQMRDSVLARLPERQTIEQDLEQAWKDVPESEQIQQDQAALSRHAHRDRPGAAGVDVSPAHAAGIERLKQGAIDLDYVGTVNIYFVNSPKATIVSAA